MKYSKAQIQAKFHKIPVIRFDDQQLIIQRAGRLTRPKGKLLLTMSPNQAVRTDLMQFNDVLKKAA